MSVAVDHGYLPPGKYIINHDIMRCTAQDVVGNHHYSGRALGLSEPWDIIQLHPDLKPQWKAIVKHYANIGLSHTENVIWDVDLDRLASHIGHHPSVFYYGPDESRYWGDYEWLETVEYINSKNNFIALAKELGVHVPNTLCFARVADIAPGISGKVNYPCYLKASVSVVGVGIYRCENEAQLLAALGKFEEDAPVQVQEEVKADTFLNIQFRIVGKQAYRLAVSEQILDGFAHQGNRVPARYEPWETVEPIANWLRDHGMKGVFAFDVAVEQTDRGLRFPAIECNPRFNGSSYPTVIAHKLDIPEWRAVSLQTRFRHLSDIDLGGIEFNMQSGEGVVIVNWGTIAEGKLGILLAGSVAVQDALATELEKRL